MLKTFATYITLFCALASTTLSAGCGDETCCRSIDCSVGWRRDDLNWKTHRLDSSYVSGHAKSKIHFKDINSYTLNAKGRWVGSQYYIRASAEYGLTDKGRATERFKISSPYLHHSVGVETNEPIKRRSEVYDFDAAVGYPFAFCCNRLNVTPLIGFSYHRQHIRVKDDEKFSCSKSCSSSCCSSSSSSSCPSSSSSGSSRSCSGCSSCSSSCCSDHSSCSDFFCYHSSDSFFLSSSNPFRGSPSSNPFDSRSSDPNIASALGLGTIHRTSNYRFTWYGFYLGTDIAYALDCNWTLFAELEGHFLDRCHRKRKSWTGVYFVDDYHKETWAYGFNGVVGLTYYIANCWYTTLTVDYDWWKGAQKHDDLHWQKVGCKIGLGYMF